MGGPFTIDWDVEPSVPEHLKLFKHTKIEETEEVLSFGLYYDEEQPEITGTKLLKKLQKQGMVLANATLLDYMLAHPEVIQDNWKTEEGNRFSPLYICFWGTLYTLRSDAFPDKPYVRTLFFEDEIWRSGVCALSNQVVWHYASLVRGP